MKESMRFVMKLTNTFKEISETLSDRYLEFLRELKKSGKLSAASYFSSSSGRMIIRSVKSPEAIVIKAPFIAEKGEDFQFWKWIQTFSR